MRNKGKWVVIGVLYIIVLLLVFAPVILGKKSLYPYSVGRSLNQVGQNESVQMYVLSGGTYWDAGASDWIEIPVIEEMRRSLWNKESLLWNSYNSLGMPVIPNSSAATTSPFEIIPLLFGGEQAWNFLYIFRLWFIMFFSYAFLRELDLSDMVSFMGGGVLGLSGYAMYHMNMWHFNVDAALPLLMFVSICYVKKDTLYRWGCVCVATAIMMLGGNPQNLITCVALTHIFFISKTVVKNCSWKEKVLEYVKYCSAYLLAVCWTMFFWIPFLELFANGYNYHAGGDQGLFSIPLKNVLGFLFPGIYFDVDSFYTYLCYIGVGVLPIIFLYTNLKDNKTWVFIGFALLYLLKIIGFPLLQWIGRLPILSMVNYWKYSFSFYFSIIVIFAYAMENLKNESVLSKAHKVKRWIMTLYYIVMSFIVIDAISTLRQNRQSLSDKLEIWIPYLLFIVIVWILTIICSSFEMKIRKNFFMLSMVISISVEILIVYGYLNNFRIDPNIALDNNVVDFKAVKLNQEKGYERISAIGNICMGNLSSNYELYNISGYTAVPVAYYYEFMKELVLNDKLDINFMNPISSHYIEESNKYLDLMGVSTVIMESVEPLETSSLQMIYENGYFRIYKNENYFDKAFYVYDYEQMESKEDIFEFLRKQSNLAQKISIESNDMLYFPHGSLEDAENSVEIVEYVDGTVRLTCNSNKDGFLVLNDLYYPGWKAYVDGDEVDIYKTDYIFRSIYLTAGTHEVVFSYEPESVRIGIMISGISILGFLSLMLIKRRK